MGGHIEGQGGLAGGSGDGRQARISRGTRPHLLNRAVLKGGGKGKDLRNANRNERSRARSLLHGHGTFSTSKVGGWQRLAVRGP